ncbi:MAG: hypothetical protein HC814_04480 [Rhodobacteraceae bacterium]|nr:hypothetical protein [Paracoccaceae bacterium]
MKFMNTVAPEAFAAAQAERRLALVIGNDAYVNIAPLKKAANDAAAIADTLESLGFQVTRAQDVTRRDMNRTIQQFVAGIEKGDTAMFFYAGHGVEIDGQNYLLPVDVPDADAVEAEFIAGEAMALDDILFRLRDREARLNLVVLDACRNNPFRRTGTRSLGGGAGWRGFRRTRHLRHVFGRVGEAALDRLSDDDENPNSVFTRTLIPLMKKPGLDLVDTAREVRRQVRKLALSVRHDQTPAYYDAVLGDFFFTGDAEAAGSDGAENGQQLAALPSGEETPDRSGSNLREEVKPTVELPAEPAARSLIVTGGEKDSIRLWDADSARLISELEGEKIEISTVKLVSGGRALLVAGKDGALFSYSLPGFKKVNAFYPGFATTAIAELPDGKLVIGGGNGMMAAVDPLRFEVLWSAAIHGDIISPILVADEGKSVISAFRLTAQFVRHRYRDWQAPCFR